MKLTSILSLSLILPLASASPPGFYNSRRRGSLSPALADDASADETGPEVLKVPTYPGSDETLEVRYWVNDTLLTPESPVRVGHLLKK